MKFSLHQLAYPLIALLLLLGACGSPYQPEEEPEEEQEEQIERNDTVPPDGVLETVTWNLGSYGDGTYGSDNWGPNNEYQQTKNILQVADSLQADLYAFQEVYSQQALDDITKNMKGYKGFVSEHVDWKQKMAFAYNTNTIDSVSSGAITEGQDSNDWAGRYPLFFEFKYNYEEGNTSIPVYAIVIHAKANTGNESEKEEAYNRRKRAAESLYQYLQNKKPDAHIVFLGDFNDDLDVSIYDGESTSPYHNFVNNEESYYLVTEPITKESQSSYVAGDYSDLIDHIIVSDEIEPYYIQESVGIYFDALDFIDSYEHSTSDHLPVWAKFDVSAPKAVINN